MYFGDDRSGPTAHLTLKLSDRYNKGECVVNIGRHDSNHFFLEDVFSAVRPRILSRYHASVKRGTEDEPSEDMYLEDRGSFNGTYLNERRLPPNFPHKITNGDTISFGGPRYVSRNGVVMKNPYHFVLLTVPPLHSSCSASSTDTTCAICLDEQRLPMRTTHCSHSLCAACVVDYELSARTNNFEIRCPTCRTPFIGPTVDRDWVRNSQSSLTTPCAQRGFKEVNCMNEQDFV
eukprot:gene27093-33327_t